MKLKKDRKRSVDEIIEDIRSQVSAQEPAVRAEFVQVLQDMIGDLTSEPEPIQIKLFSPDGAAARAMGTEGRGRDQKIPGVVDVLDGIENTISGPAATFQIDSSVAARAGFTPEEIATDASAIVEGEPAATPVVSNDRAYTVRVRFPASNRASLEAINEYAADQQQRQDRHARSDWPQSPNSRDRPKFVARICSATFR